MRTLLTLGTNPARRKLTKPAPGNLRYKVQFHILYVDKIHRHNGQYRESPYIPAEVGECDWSSHGRDYGEIFETLHCLHVPYRLDIEELNFLIIVYRTSYLLFGIARKARSVTAFRWARRTLLWTSPLDIYKGWYSLWPVPTETVVLSLPRTIGQKVDPWFLGSFAISSYLNYV